MADEKDAAFILQDDAPRSPERIKQRGIDYRDFGIPYTSPSLSQDDSSILQELSSIHSSDIARRDFPVAAKAPPPGHITTYDANRESMPNVSNGKKDGLVPSADAAVQPPLVAVSAPLAPGSAGSDSRGGGAFPPSPRGINE